MDEPLGPLTLLLLIVPAIALRIALGVIYGRRRLTAVEPMRVLLSLASTTMFVLAAAGGVVGLFGVWLLFIPLPVAVVVVVLMVIDRTRHSEHRALVWALASAAQRGIPLSEAARAFADESQGDTGVRALVLAEALERGQPLSLAVGTARLRMGAAAKLAVRLGERLSLLGPAMKQQLDDSQQAEAALRDVIGRLCYLFTIVAVMIAVCVFLMLQIVPVFQKMFEEFGLRLPMLTKSVIGMAWHSEQLLMLWGIVSLVSVGLVIVVLNLLLIVLFALLIVEFRDARRAGSRFSGQRSAQRVWPYAKAFFLAFVLWQFFPLLMVIVPLLYFVGWFPRNLPVVWWLFKRYDGALVMRGLALAVRRGMPLPSAMHLVADTYPLSIIAGRIQKAAQSIDGGEQWCDSLRQTGLIGQTDAALLAAAQRTGNLDWALEEMADSALRRQAYRVQVLLATFFPMVLLALGVLVAMIVIGLFLPLIALIQGLA